MEISVAVGNAKLDAYETAIGASPIMRIYDGAKPANCAAARAGNVIAQGTLPADWLANASAGSKGKAGTWTLTGQAAAGAGTTGVYWSILDSTGTTCHLQGPISELGLSNNNIANAQPITINAGTLTAGGI